MKIELEKNDLDYIERVNKGLEAGDEPPLFVSEKGKRYSIVFTCEDVAKANVFVMMLMNPGLREEEGLADKLGISVECINYRTGDEKKEELKAYLQSFLQELERM